jgi:hypothetical protein
LPTRPSGSHGGFHPTPDEVAKQAYSNYVNEGSEAGRDVQHWLAAEAQLIREHQQLRLG